MSKCLQSARSEETDAARPSYLESHKPLELQRLRTTIDGNEAFTVIALRGGWVIGQVKVWLEESGPATLVDLFVNEGQRGLGFGTEIVAFALAQVPGPVRAYHLPDSPARGLLQRAGFRDTGARGVDGMSPDYIWVETGGAS